MHHLIYGAFAALGLCASLSGQCLQDIASPLPPSSSTFGAVVAVDGDVGVSLEFNVIDVGGGWVHFYGRTPAGEWALDQTEAFTLDFITEMALDAEGGRLAIGDYLWSPSNGRPGRVVVYTRPAPGQPWALDTTIESPTPQVGSSFGESVAWAGDQLIVGQPGFFGGPPRVHVLERNGQTGNWVSQQILTGQNGSAFGRSLAVEGDELLVGASSHGANPMSPSFGAVFSYRRSSATGLWSPVSLIQPPSGLQTSEGFGFKVRREGDRFVAGSPFRTVQGVTSAGRAIVFRQTSGGAWVEDQIIEPPSPVQALNFGRYFDLDGSLLVISGPGLIHTYRDSPGGFAQGGDLLPSQNIGFFYGRAIDSDGELVLVGDSAGPTGTNKMGRIEARDLRDRNLDAVRDACQPLGAPFCGPAAPNSTGSSSSIFGLDTGAPLMSLDLAVESLPAGQFGYFLVSMDAGLVMNPGGSAGDLCISGPSLARYSSDVFLTDGSGVTAFTVDATQIPQGGGFVAAAAGQTWNFQCWHRDVGGTSNFSDALAVTF